MYSTIYEFSEQPISASRRATIDSLPEWFFQTVADSAADTDDITRAVQIRCLEQHFGDLCIRCVEGMLDGKPTAVLLTRGDRYAAELLEELRERTQIGRAHV